MDLAFWDNLNYFDDIFLIQNSVLSYTSNMYFLSVIYFLLQDLTESFKRLTFESQNSTIKISEHGTKALLSELTFGFNMTRGPGFWLPVFNGLWGFN